MAEKSKVSVRNVRKEANDMLKIMLKEKKISEDENNKYKNGDKVLIIESKPFSKNKKFQVMENSK